MRRTAGDLPSLSPSASKSICTLKGVPITNRLPGDLNVTHAVAALATARIAALTAGQDNYDVHAPAKAKPLGTRINDRNRKNMIEWDAEEGAYVRLHRRQPAR